MSAQPQGPLTAPTVAPDLAAIRIAAQRLAAMAQRLTPTDMQLLADLATQAEGVRQCALRARAAAIHRGAA